MLNFVYIIVGLLGLFVGGESLVKGSTRVATAFRVSSLVIGLTIVAIGTSMPELVVSTISAVQGKPAIAMGNVIGSNIANIGLILGISGLVSALTVKESLVRREIPIMILVSITAVVMTLDGEIGRIDGIILLIGFVAFNGVLYYFTQQETEAEKEHAAAIDPDKSPINLPMEFGRVVFGITLLVIGAQALVTGASDLARSVGISELVIGVTMVAVGTSLPELATSIMAAMRKETDIAIGNVVGSNVANILLILGLTAFISPIDVGQTDLSVVEYVVMIAFAVMLLPFLRNRQLGRVESALLLGAYIAFILYSFFFAQGEIPPIP